MTRARSETIGQLGRAEARTSRPPTNAPRAPLPPREPPPPERGAIASWIHGAFVDNLGLKFLSMVLAVTVFLLVNTDRDREKTASVPLSYTLPDNKVLISDRVKAVRVTVKGPSRRLRKFEDGDIEGIDLDLTHVPAGDFHISPDMIHVPSGLTITSISPPSVRVEFDRRVDKVVEIAPVVKDRPPHGYVVAEIKAAPATVEVRGAESVVSALTTLRTREIQLDGHADTFDINVDLLPPNGVELVGATQASVHVSVDEQLVTRKLPGLAVAVRGATPEDAAKWTVTPAQVEITLTGALLAVEKARAAMTPIVKLTQGETKAHEADVLLEGLPPGIGAKISPERVKIAPAR